MPSITHGRTLLLLVSILIYVIKERSCLPIKENDGDDFPWTRPCGFEITGSSQSGKSIASILDTLSVRSYNAYLELKTVRDEYTAPGPYSRIGNDPHYIGFLDNIRFEKFPHIPSEQEITEAFKKEMVDLFIETYGNISVAFVYLEQVKINESNAENGEFSENFHLIDSYLRIILCELDIAIKVNLNSSIPSYVSPDVMPGDLRHESKNRRIRDYVIVKNSMDLMSAFHSLFKGLLDKEMSV